MPVPQGNITSTQTWSLDGDSKQAVEETEQDNTASEETDAAEQAVVEGESEEQE